LLVPLPSADEQRRIVAKVDELMALCDRLEATQAERESRRDRLVAASLHRLSQPAEDAAAFRADARFALDHLARFTTRPNQVSDLRQTILSLAVRGKLVPQDPKDEPAPEFGIAASSDRADRLAMELPGGWSWARVSDVAEARLGKMLDKAKNSGRPYRYLRNTNVHWFSIRLDELKTMPIEDLEVDTFLLRKGDVLICEGGHGIGRTAVWTGQEEGIVFQKALHRVRPGRHLDAEYFAQCVFVYFHTGILQHYYTGVGIPHFTGVALSKLVFPLPPIGEQRRVVAKVNELMSICDRLEAQLSTVRTESSRLLEAVLHEALAPAA
jgi:type I restriction enzyme S subunit